MPLDEMPLAFSKICRMETRSILTRAIGLRNTSIFEGNSWRPILNGDDVKQRKDLGGFQLLDLIIPELKSHMTCYNSMPLIG